MPSIAQIQDANAEPREVKVEWDGPTIVVQYVPNVITGRIAQEAADAPESQQVASTAKALHLILAGWDVTDDDGNPLEVTVENLMELPLVLLGIIMRRVGEDARPDPTSGGSFAGG